MAELTEADAILYTHICRAALIGSRKGLVYQNAADFILQHGKRGWAITEYPHDLDVLAPKCCYGNSIFMSVKYGFAYIEGFMLMPHVFAVSDDLEQAVAFSNPELGSLIPHAWNSTAAGELIDSTLANGALAYCGVEFSVERADDATWNGDACILDDFNRGWPLFRQRWNGETKQEYPASPLLVGLRAVARGSGWPIVRS